MKRIALINKILTSTPYKDEAKYVGELLISGWHQFAIFDFDGGKFTNIKSINADNCEFLEHQVTSGVKKIITYGVHSCTVIVMRLGNKYCLAHLDNRNINDRVFGKMREELGGDAEHGFISFIQAEKEPIRDFHKLMEKCNPNSVKSFDRTNLAERHDLKNNPINHASHLEFGVYVNGSKVFIKCDVILPTGEIATECKWDLEAEHNLYEATFGGIDDNYLNNIADVLGLEKIG
jgi:hypothetical protein